MTKIEWADKTWNPVTGCTPISEGCENCYAARAAHRLAHIEGSGYGNGVDSPNPRGAFDVELRRERFCQPMSWRKPRRVFVCSMGDLFHPDVEFEWIRDIWQAASFAPQHTYMILTKRPARMLKFTKWLKVHGARWLDSMWLGVTVENQTRADERIPILLQTPAAVRFVSVEPMLGPVDFRKVPGFNRVGLDLSRWWVICGGETGPGARPMRPEWAMSLQDQCQVAGVPFFFKQWGEWVSPSQMPGETYREIEDFGNGIGITNNPRRVGKKRAGRLLDGREWSEFPGVSRP